ncbi:hypothetical protein BMS3Bbin02_00617 [bacterium BMS3Bbin02]|nr:hypothetical protein BMS3Bbin02_00617 [bacterium BMS3Bbin02]
MLQFQHFERYVGCDVGVAVAVATHPGAETHGCQCRWVGNAESCHLVGELVKQVTRDLAEYFVEVVDGRTGFINGGRTCIAQLVGLPDEIDQLRYPPDDSSIVGRRQSRVGPFAE